MAQLTISQVARQIQIRPSAIRYHERIGLLPPAERRGGQRRYDSTVLYRLAIIQQARQLGFTLSEIRYLFGWFQGCHSPVAALANAIPAKAGEVGPFNGWDKNGAGRAESIDDEVPM